MLWLPGSVGSSHSGDFMLYFGRVPGEVVCGQKVGVLLLRKTLLRTVDQGASRPACPALLLAIEG